MATTRRGFLTYASLGAVGVGAGLAGCSRGGDDSGGGSGDGGATNLVLTWWGNEVRNANTSEAVAAYTEANSDIVIEEQPGEWASYWDRLATQTAGSAAPDMIQMDMNYISEYGERGALLDLAEHGLDTSGFLEGTADSGLIGGKTFGVNAGINTPVVLVNPGLFDDAGVDLPDDMAWTWDDWHDVALALTDATDGEIIGSSAFYSNDALLSAWVRQRGKELFVDGTLGFTVDDYAEWLEYHMRMFEAGAIPSASQIEEDNSVSQDQSMFSTGRTAIAPWWSNQIEALEASSGATLDILRYPSFDGDAMTRKAWYKASMLWSASATTEHPEETVELINWWVNSPECGAINLAERGVPPNTEVAASIQDSLSDVQQRAVQFITDIEPELGETPVAPPAGGGNQLAALLQRYGGDVVFGNSTINEAAQGFVDELTASIEQAAG